MHPSFSKVLQQDSTPLDISSPLESSTAPSSRPSSHDSSPLSTASPVRTDCSPLPARKGCSRSCDRHSCPVSAPKFDCSEAVPVTKRARPSFFDDYDVEALDGYFALNECVWRANKTENLSLVGSGGTFNYLSGDHPSAKKALEVYGGLADVVATPLKRVLKPTLRVSLPDYPSNEVQSVISEFKDTHVVIQPHADIRKSYLLVRNSLLYPPVHDKSSIATRAKRKAAEQSNRDVYAKKRKN